MLYLFIKQQDNRSIQYLSVYHICVSSVSITYVVSEPSEISLLPSEISHFPSENQPSSLLDFWQIEAENDFHLFGIYLHQSD